LFRCFLNWSGDSGYIAEHWGTEAACSLKVRLA
jgi:hypothetical protein